jgi:ribonuclease E
MTGISRKIPPQERDRLKRIIQSISNTNMGVIIRTAAEGVSEAELQADLDELIETYKRIFTLYEESKNHTTPEKLYEDASTQIRVIRDMFNDSFDDLITGDSFSHELVQDYLNKSAPKFLTKVKKWEDIREDSKEGLFKHYGIEDQVQKAMNRKVLLPSGGSLVIDHTEAMTVIDVNTGRNTGHGSMEETIAQNNLEAAQEIVNQLRLRDVGGIVVIDFVDMMLSSNQNKVLTRFIECLSRDRTRHQVAELTSLGLVQLTRKRRGPGLAYQMDVICKECGGTGFLAPDVYVLGTKDPEKIHRYEENKKVLIPDQKRAKAAAKIAEAISSESSKSE